MLFRSGDERPNIQRNFQSPETARRLVPRHFAVVRVRESHLFASEQVDKRFIWKRTSNTRNSEILIEPDTLRATEPISGRRGHYYFGSRGGVHSSSAVGRLIFARWS